MAKLIGPLMSMDASGSIAGTLTFAKVRGRNYVRQLVIPANPRTAGQTSNRAMMRFLGSQWTPQTALDPTMAASWQTRADQGKYSPFNAFTSFNMNQWTQFAAPQTIDTNPSVSRAATYTTWAAIDGVRQITLTAKVSLATDPLWGLVIFRDTAAIVTPTKDMVVAVIFADEATDLVYVDTPLEPGTYHYRALAFSKPGAFATAAATDINATAS